jgi:hypothetical protein
LWLNGSATAAMLRNFGSPVASAKVPTVPLRVRVSGRPVPKIPSADHNLKRLIILAGDPYQIGKLLQIIALQWLTYF